VIVLMCRYDDLNDIIDDHLLYLIVNVVVECAGREWVSNKLPQIFFVHM